jgi:hypothetical protein
MTETLMCSMLGTVGDVGVPLFVHTFYLRLHSGSTGEKALPAFARRRHSESQICFVGSQACQGMGGVLFKTWRATRSTAQRWRSFGLCCSEP